MSLNSEWPCWEIMHCNPENARQCPAYQSSSPCWDVTRKIDAYSFNICRDCLVYVIKQKDSMLSNTEIMDIMQRKGVDMQGSQCPGFKTSNKENFMERA